MYKGRSLPGLWGGWIILVGLLVMGITGCQPGEQSQPSSTHTVTAQVNPNAPPKQTVYATRVTPTWTLRPAATPSPTLPPIQPSVTDESAGLGKDAMDLADGQSLLILDPVQIFTPGDGTRVTPPIVLEANLTAPRTGQLLRIELYSQEGKLLVRKIIAWQTIQEQEGEYQDQIDFEIAKDSLEGWLIVRIEDHPGSPLAVNSTRLTLLSKGLPDIHRQGWQAKWIDIQTPGIMTEIEGGVLQISGLTRLKADKPLKIQIVDSQGRVVGQRLAGITEAGEFSPFIAEVSYQVSERTEAKVLVYRDDGPNGVITHLASQPVVLLP